MRFLTTTGSRRPTRSGGRRRGIDAPRTARDGPPARGVSRYSQRPHGRSGFTSAAGPLRRGRPDSTWTAVRPGHRLARQRRRAQCDGSAAAGPLARRRGAGATRYRWGGRALAQRVRLRMRNSGCQRRPRACWRERGLEPHALRAARARATSVDRQQP